MAKTVREWTDGENGQGMDGWRKRSGNGRMAKTARSYENEFSAAETKIIVLMPNDAAAAKVAVSVQMDSLSPIRIR